MGYVTVLISIHTYQSALPDSRTGSINYSLSLFGGLPYSGVSLGRKGFCHRSVLRLICVVPYCGCDAVMEFQWTRNSLFLGISPAGSHLKNNSVPPYYRVFAATISHLNRHLSPTSRVLMLFEAHGFYFNVQVIQDNVLTNWPLLANRASEIDCLTNTEITHVLVNFADLNNYLHRGLNPATIRWDVFRQFADRCLVQVFQGPGHDLYEVRRRVL